MLEQVPALVPHGFIYLRTSADTCARRLRIRNRSEESGVTLDYLSGIQARALVWLLGFWVGRGACGVWQRRPSLSCALRRSRATLCLLTTPKSSISSLTSKAPLSNPFQPPKPLTTPLPSQNLN